MRPCVPITLQHVNVHTMESVVGNIVDFFFIWVSKLTKDVPIWGNQEYAVGRGGTYSAPCKEDPDRSLRQSMIEIRRSTLTGRS